MRFLVYLLLVANLGLFAWIAVQPPQQPPEYLPIPVPPGIEPLALLSERPVKKQPGEPAIAEPVAEIPVGSVVSEGQDVEADEQPSKADNESVQARLESMEQPAPGQPVVAQPEPVCRTVGPLMRKSEVDAISEMLAGAGYEVSLRGGEVREPSGYWVYMPAMPAREARRIVAKLDANGMKDYFIGKQNYISLGIFSRKDKAKLRLDEVEALGFDAILDQRYRTRNVFWLDIEDGEQPLLGSALWEQIQSEHTDIRVQRVSCE